jgi:proteasome lid subunit RPN8/RPN11
MTPSHEKDNKALDVKAFEEILSSGIYHKLELTQNWTDTALAELYMSKKSIQALDLFLRKQRNQHINEQEGSIPEIGGFLLGKYSFSEKTKRFKVALEEFVPIVPEEHDTYQLQFSTESLVNELGEAQDQYPELALVGWFHTHPGHGLFLSKPDMAIHDGFFRERYQFAMEIDTLTENLNTGFFTRTTSGGANNLDTVLPGSKWFEWTEIEKTTRRK